MQATDVAILRGAAVPTAAVGAVAIVLGGIFAGGSGALGALVGTVIVLVFFLVGQLVLGWVLHNNPQLALTVAMGLYLVKIGFLLVLLLLLAGTTAFNTKVFALAILACTLTWTASEVAVFSRTKMLIIEPGVTPPGFAPQPQPQAPGPGVAAAPSASTPAGPTTGETRPGGPA